MIADTFNSDKPVKDDTLQKFQEFQRAWDETKIRGKITWSLDDEDMLGFDLTGDEKKDAKLFWHLCYSGHNMIFNKEHPELKDQ